MITDERLRVFREAPDRAAIVTDFDGTLARIVDDPAGAAPVPGAVAALHDLARHYGTVAVVSGRPVAFLVDQLGELGSGLTLSGLYGMECWQGGSVVVEPAAEVWRPVIDDVVADARASAPAGIGIEPKGLSVTLHYRTAPEHGEWARSWTAEVAAATGLGLHPARMSYELRPPVTIDKGTVVAGLASARDAICFLGDDRGDLPAFAALDRLAAAGKAITLKVVVESPEAPPDVLAAADTTVAGPEAAVEFLRRLLP